VEKRRAASIIRTEAVPNNSRKTGTGLDVDCCQLGKRGIAIKLQKVDFHSLGPEEVLLALFSFHETVDFVDYFWDIPDSVEANIGFSL